MAGSRLEKLGTIFTRVTGLIKSGAIKVDDRPIWYDVYRAFPPESEPHFAKTANPVKINDVFYPEDVFRAEFHKNIRGQLPAVHLKETQQTQNATKIAVDMFTADKSLSANQVAETLKKNRTLPDYNTQPKKVYSITKTDETKPDKESNVHSTTESKVDSS